MQTNSRTYLTNFFWRFFERAVSQVVTLVVSIVLARLLDPSSYGMIALVTVFIVIMNIFVDGGLGNALIQKKEADNLDFSSVFYFNIAFSLVLYLLLWIAAPYIESFYAEEGLTPVIRVLGISVVIASLKNVQLAFVSRNFLFKKLFWTSVIGVVFSGVAGVAMAYLGFGVWALVAQNLTSVGVTTFMLWLMVGWRPKWAFSFERLGSLVSFGWKLLVSNLVYNGYDQLRQLLIGKFYSAEDLAFYNQGHKYPSAISNAIGESVNSILFPAMSGVQDDHERVKGMLRKANILGQFVVAPFMVGLAVCAKTVVLLLLTEKWLPCVPFLQVFCLACVFGCMGNANQNATIAIGRSDIKLKVEVVKTAIDLVVLVTTVPFGPMVVAIGSASCSVIRIFICAWPNRRLLDYPFSRQILDIAPSLALNAIMALAVWLVGLIALPTALRLLAQVLTGVTVYVGLSMVFKLEAFQMTVDLVKQLFGRKSD